MNRNTVSEMVGTQNRVASAVNSDSTVKKGTAGMSKQKIQETGVANEVISNQQEFGTGKEMRAAGEPLGPFIQVMLATGDTQLIPIDTVNPREIKNLTSLVKAGGGVVPNTGGHYRICIAAIDCDFCTFGIEKDGVPIAVGNYQNSSQQACENWNNMLQTAEEHSMPCEKCIVKPAEPWLAVMMQQSLALVEPDELARVTELGQCLAETWRRLPRYMRSPIMPPKLAARFKEALQAAAADSSQSQNQRTVDEESERQIAHLKRQNDDLTSKFRHLKETNADLNRQLSTAASLQREVNRLNGEVSEKNGSIKTLEKANKELRGEIDQKVSVQVVDIRREHDEFEFRALLAEEERDEALKLTEKAEHKVKLLEQQLRKNGLEPLTVFCHEDVDKKAS